MSGTPGKQGRSRINLHAGRALMMVANRYPSLVLTLAEAVQNGIDAGAKNLFIGIDNLRRSVVVADNGQGVTQENFDLALTRVAETRKTRDKLGRFGIGLVSPLNKCKRFTFTTWPASENAPMEWIFQQDRIASQAADIDIPHRRLGAMPRLGQVFDEAALDLGVRRWQTIVRMHDITKDRAISAVNLDDLEDQIRTKFGHAMRRDEISCRVVIVSSDGVAMRDITPQTYSGEPLPLYELDGGAAGVIELELYRAKRLGGSRQGQVSVSEMDVIYPVSWREFANQARGGGWTKMSDAFDVLGSGYFEGIIRAKGISLAPERNKFEHNDALFDLYVAIDTWYQEVGKAAYEVEHEQQRDERYYQLSLGVMTSVRDMLRRPEFASLVEGIRSQIQMGRIGHGHGEKLVAGDDSRPTTRVGQGGVGVERQSSDKTRSGGRGSGPTRDGDLPAGVVGRGKQRSLVKEDSLGLWIEVTDFEFSTAVWDFDRRTGLLSFNSGSAVWSELDGAGLKRRTAKNDRMLEHLQKWVVLQVLNLLLLPDEQYEDAKLFVSGQLKPYVRMFIQGA